MKGKRRTPMIHLASDDTDAPTDAFDVIFITGDAYIDHPSNGVALLARLLDDKGYSVGIIAQPDPSSIDDFKTLGRPRLLFAVTAGLVDSMVANYTPLKKERDRDRLSYGEGMRPDRATIVYTQKAKQAYKGVKVAIGGIEASLRRFSHYDYWQNKVRRSILMDSKADILVYGMGERQMLEILSRLGEGRRLSGICGTAIAVKECDPSWLELPTYEEVTSSKRRFLDSFMAQYTHQDPFRSPPLAEPYGDWHVVQYPPALPLATDEMDYLYELPFTRKIPHTGRGAPHSMEPVQFSVITHRGCFGGCSFCALSMHQGRIIQSRSVESIVREAQRFSSHPDFKGTIDDVGGPTANMYAMGCTKGHGHVMAHSIRTGEDIPIPVATKGCTDPCLYPACPHLDLSHGPYREVLERLRSIEGVNHVFIRSGIRHDLALCDRGFIKELCEHHVSGQLKLAPEHTNDRVLAIMNKPPLCVFEEFMHTYKETN
ncbi:MAG TPA: YgiQ family radical SAM protein, partial [Methanomicrobia archaeon]|nr:YgiQ family radical SAM protein [Methanomicrobia archaeon]